MRMFIIEQFGVELYAEEWQLSVLHRLDFRYVIAGRAEKIVWQILHFIAMRFPHRQCFRQTVEERASIF